MKKFLFSLSLFVFALTVLLLSNCKKNEHTTHAAHQLYSRHINRLMASAEAMRQFILDANNPQMIQQSFRQARMIYKKIEGIVEYYNPTTAKSINGAPIPEVEVYDNKVLPPQGFQVIEEFIFPHYDATHKEDLLREANALVVNIKHLKYTAPRQILFLMRTYRTRCVCNCFA